MSDADAQNLAEEVGRALYARDIAAQTNGITLDRIGPGYAKMQLTVRQHMLNGHAICHGGYVFLLADTAFAYACNARNQNTVASACSIDFIAPVREGDVLTAEAIEQSLTGRTGVYDIEVTNQRRERVALFRGRSYRVKGEVIADDA